MSFFRTRFIGFLIGALISWPVAAQVVSDGIDVPLLKGFDQAMLQFMQNHDIPDGQLAITWQGRLVLARAYNNQSENPVDIRTRFRIASVSKSLTSTLMHRLQQDGEVSLDDTIDQYLDLTPHGQQVTDDRLKSVTVRNLLQHLGGFGAPPDLGYDPTFSDARVVNTLGVNYPVEKLDILRFMNGVALTYEPGTTHAYSNYGFMLAGLVIEAASGLSYGAYADRILNPIGIIDARLSRSQKHRMYSNEATAWSGISNTTVMDTSGQQLPLEYGALNYENTGAYGGWTLSMVELVRWFSNLDDPNAENALLNPDSVNQMFALPENWAGSYNEGDYFYSSGWAVRDYGNGRRNTWHSGSLPGTTAHAVRTTDGWNYAMAFNRRNETAPGNWIGEIDAAMWNVYGQLTQMPDHDLFDQSLPAAPAPITAQTTGSWYDLTHDGEGFVVQVINPTTAVVYWFTYDENGAQRWYFGIGEVKGHQIILETLYETMGGRFGPDFNPDDVVLTPVGSLVLSFYDNSRGKADYRLHGESGYQELSRLTQPFTGSDSMLAGDWRNGLWYDPTHDGEGFVVEVLPNGQILIFWFTYNSDGSPAWMIGIADAAALDQGVPVTLQRPDGGNFGVAFDPTKVARHPNGEVQFRLGCTESAEADYSDGNSQFPDVMQSLVQLAGYVSSPCP